MNHAAVQREAPALAGPLAGDGFGNATAESVSSNPPFGRRTQVVIGRRR